MQAKTQNAPPLIPEGHDTETILIVDFGSQYIEVIARRVRASGVFCRVISPKDTEPLLTENTKGIILSGGPGTVYEEKALHIPPWVLNSGLPVLGICYGMHLITHELGGKIRLGSTKEYGNVRIKRTTADGPLFKGIDKEIDVWMSHQYEVETLPEGFTADAISENNVIVVMRNGNYYGLQFHPEVTHTPQGAKIINNFVFKVCQCSGRWTPANFVKTAVISVQKQVKDAKVICALSGGVDSTVAASIIHRAIGDNLRCVFVDNGLLRLNEGDQVMSALRNLGIKVSRVNEQKTFLSALQGVVDPEQKRRIIGHTFISIFEKQAKQEWDAKFLAQGTLYPDVIESKTTENPFASKIKTHHNVGGLPDNMKFKLIEPLRYMFKDEVREAGIELGLPQEIVKRQPFPGPGLAIRIIGEVTQEKLDVLRTCDSLIVQILKKKRLYDGLWQSFAVLTNTRTVGVMGEGRTYGFTIAIRAVNSQDAMTADWARIPHKILAEMSNRIVNEVPEVNHVVYDITSKPPGTIEWE